MSNSAAYAVPQVKKTSATTSMFLSFTTFSVTLFFLLPTGEEITILSLRRDTFAPV